jgi:histidinol dehydrogenase
MEPINLLRMSDPHFDKSFDALLRRKVAMSAEVEELVKTILRSVQEKGDSALFEYAEKYDQTIVDAASVMISPEVIDEAYTTMDAQQINDFRLAAERIEQFHKRRLRHLIINEPTDAMVDEVFRPLERVGIYVPGGKALYPSSVLMTAIPARVAGVDEIVMVSPRVSSTVLAAAKIAGVSRVYRIGGAHAIAALAYGTDTIPRVDKIVGPGNVYVETAKRLVFGAVGIDMLAGPSEVLIVADETAVPAFAAADLIAQAEHDEDALCLIIATSESFLTAVEKELFLQLDTAGRQAIARKSIENNCVMILAHSVDKALHLANKIAPEHLELMTENPQVHLQDITHAGAVFLGNYSPVAVGDYLAGPSHVLPTAGTARFFSPLGVEDFVKRISIISFTRDGLSKLGKTVTRLAQLEGLDAHAKAVAMRILPDD